MHEISQSLVSELAPKGRLRVAINYGNPVLAHRDASGDPDGVSVEIARELSRQANIGIEFVTFDAAGKVFEAAAHDVWDVAFLASDPARATQILFTEPYVTIEATAIVARNSALQTFADLDQPGVRIAVGQGAAYELQLMRRIKHATIVRSPTSDGAVRLFESEQLEAAAGVRRPLNDYAADRPHLRVFSEALAEIRQAMGTPLGRDTARAYLDDFLSELKADGFISAALQRHGQTDAVVS